MTSKELEKKLNSVKRLKNFLLNIMTVSFFGLVVSVLMLIWFDFGFWVRLTLSFFAVLFVAWLLKDGCNRVLKEFEGRAEDKPSFKERLKDMAEQQKKQ